MSRHWSPDSSKGLWGRWGLLRHYWVLVKLVMNLFATGVLLLYTQTLGVLADQAAAMTELGVVTLEQRLSPVVHAGAALLLLVVAVALSLYKPRGLTRYGRDQHAKAAWRPAQHGST